MIYTSLLAINMTTLVTDKIFGAILDWNVAQALGYTKQKMARSYSTVKRSLIPVIQISLPLIYGFTLVH